MRLWGTKFFIKVHGYILGAIALICLNGCANFQPISEGRFVPKKAEWVVIPQTVTGQTALIFEGVYYKDYGPLPDGTPQFSYFRFWANGRVLVRGLNHRPTAEDAESFQECWIGYYRGSGPDIYAELFEPDMAAAWRWGYDHKSFVVTKTGMTEIRDEMNGSVTTEKIVYGFLFLPEIRRQPDW